MDFKNAIVYIETIAITIDMEGIYQIHSKLQALIPQALVCEEDKI